MHFPVQITKHGMRSLEHTQRSRSFLYATIAFVVAYLLGNTRIRFFENGQVSINLPIAEQVVGSRATRTTHPLTLARFRAFFSAVAGKSVEFENPYIWKTKADVVRTVAARDCGDLIKDSVSCTRTYDATKLHTHCGCCSQCIDRRFGVLAACCAKYEPEEMYKCDLLIGDRIDPLDRTMAESYVRTAIELREMAELAFFGRFGGEAGRVCSGFPLLRADDVARKVFELHRRHGEAISNVLTAAVEKHSADLVLGRIAPTSVLMMAVARGATPMLSKARERIDPVLSLTGAEALGASEVIDGHARDRESTVGGAQKRARSRPNRERALRIINEIYPQGVPDAATVPNGSLLKMVGERLKQAGLLGVSDETILRAAGRRRN
jgi:hypothetical protein